MSKFDTRLSKLEGDGNAGNSRFCSCYSEYISAAMKQAYDGTLNPIDYSTLPNRQDYCEKCRKPVNREFIEDMAMKMEKIRPMYEAEAARRAAMASESVPDDGDLLSPSDVADSLGIDAQAVKSFIASGRLRTVKANGLSFITRESFNEFEILYRRKYGEN